MRIVHPVEQFRAVVADAVDGHRCNTPSAAGRIKGLASASSSPSHQGQSAGSRMTRMQSLTAHMVVLAAVV